ncbi:MAG TPA: hypothetical protein VK784_07595 [Pseudonocardiaceae bacterium]|jgi:hypothetical protein|nr:hypothetical protein [Pseudonocardiaceae bacterium]
MTTAQKEVGSAALPVKTPDFYQLQGAQLHITYSTTSFDGKPRFVYQDALRTLTFEGDQIRTVTTEIGMLVTVTTLITIDSGSTTFTLLVPTVNLGLTNQAPIQTEGITTIHRFSIVPAFNQGQTELYTVTPLTGTASLVVF